MGDRTNFRALSKAWIHKYSLPERGGLSPADLPLEWGAGRGLHSSTSPLNVSVFCGTGGACVGCLGGVWEALGGTRWCAGCICVRNGSG